jgi:hypothetical protein
MLLIPGQLADECGGRQRADLRPNMTNRRDVPA